MSTELWGTFSVRDHLDQRAFIADALLYDRLVIPTKPESEDPADWPVEWNLARQTQLMAVLGDLAVPIPWTADRRSEWQHRFDDVMQKERREAKFQVLGQVAFDINIVQKEADQSYRVTRMLLADYANAETDDRLFDRLRATVKARPGSKLEAVSAYPSFDAFRVDVDLADQPVHRPRNIMPPTAIFGWDFFVPDSDERSDAEDLRLLEKAVKLAKQGEFIELRSRVNDWMSDVSEAISSGAMSMKDAREEMEARIAEYQKFLKGQAWKTWIKRAIKVADAFTGGLGLVSEPAGAIADFFLGTSEVLGEDPLKPAEAPPRIKVAAMFHESRKKLGWKPLGN